MNDDVKYYESYGYSHEEAVAQAKADRASTGLLFAVFRLIFICFKLFFLLLPSILCAFLILHWMKKPFTKTDQWEYFWWLCGTTYILECLIFFLKGWQLSLRQRNNRLWLFIIGICLLYCFVLPACMFEILIMDQIKPTPATNVLRLEIIGWLSGIILGWVTYSRYRLQQDEAPWLFSWAFRIGRAI